MTWAGVHERWFDRAFWHATVRFAALGNAEGKRAYTRHKLYMNRKNEKETTR
jgi:hypothetical protein